MSAGVMLGGAVDESLFVGGHTPAPRVNGEVAFFYLKTVKDPARSADAGRPIHASVEYIKIRVPGSRDEVDRPSRPEDYTRFSPAYAAFKAGDKEQVTGTPLKVWPRISEPQVEDLRHLKIYTVEQLASVADSNLQALGPGGRSLRDEAKAFLELAAGAAPLSRMQAALDKRDEEVAALRQQVEDLRRALEKQGKGK